jgi:5-carboxymethyl-2-hydroxymuconate isomerase
MPHIVLEHTAPLARHLNIPALLADLHQALAQVETIDPNAIKTRAVPMADFLTGTAGQTRAFAHLAVAVLAGRPQPLLRSAGDALFAILNRHVAASGQDCATSLYLHEMPAALYWK